MLKAWTERRIHHTALSSDEQQFETKNTLTGPQTVDTNAEVQDNTLQLESPEKEDTAVKQVDPVDVQKKMLNQWKLMLVNSKSQ